MNKGIYCLIIYLDKKRKIKIGKLGNIGFKKGYYCYVGSALNNLEKRINRHISKTKKIRWHIDYFLKYGKIIDVKTIKINKKFECKLSKIIEKISQEAIKNFGSSDCKCKSHLYYSKKKLSKINCVA